MAPEVFLGEKYDTTADYFSLGEMIYEIALGRHPFLPVGNEADDDIVIMTEIMNSKPDYPRSMDPDLRDLLERLLEVSPKDRQKKIKHLRSHPYFKTIDWASIEATVPCQLPSSPPSETINVATFINIKDEDSDITSREQKLFRHFSYVGKSLKPSGR
ncbi:protein kinase C delta type-like [Pyxicephalus adspersus]|uniref:protein kinase C delta type-like n=1 Tax=Pyxicephalus adspersus TaxID=30357 RepID=UPI003B5BC7D9